MRIERWIAISAMFLSCSNASAALTRDELKAMAAAFAPTNTPLQAYAGCQHVMSNAWDAYYRASYNGSPDKPYHYDHVRDLQYHALTNVSRFKAGDVVYWQRHGMTFRGRLFTILATFRCGRSDLPYLEQCADFLGNEMVEVDKSQWPSLLERMSYMQLIGYNCVTKNAKGEMLHIFSKLVGRYEKYLSDDEVPSFRSNITTRARLTAAERRIVWPAQ